MQIPHTPTCIIWLLTEKQTPTFTSAGPFISRAHAQIAHTKHMSGKDKEEKLSASCVSGGPRSSTPTVTADLSFVFMFY